MNKTFYYDYLCLRYMKYIAKFSASNFSFVVNPLMLISKLELLLVHGLYPKKENDLLRNLLLAYIKDNLYTSNALIFNY